MNGITPNPCVRCNRYIKFGLLYNIVKNKYKVDKLATGHYAKIYKDNDGQFFIQKAYDKLKDQSYFLWGIPKSILKDIIFPLGDFKKADVKNFLRKEGFDIIADKNESFDICFVNTNSYKKYIQKYGFNKNSQKGYFVDSTGKILKEHEGIYKYTIGQRKGLNISLGKRMYVRRIDFKNNLVEIGEKPYSNSVVAGRINLFLEQDRFDDNIFTGRIRYKSKEEKATLKIFYQDKVKKISVNFLNPIEASSIGQSVVIYKDELLICGGIIENINII